MKTTSRLKRTTLIMIGLSLFLIGLVSIRAFGMPLSFLMAFVILLCSLIIFKTYKYRLLISFLFIGAVILGIFRGSMFVSGLEKYKDLFGHEVTIEVTAREDAVYSERRQLMFSADNPKLTMPKPIKLIGNIKVEGRGLSMVYKGDRLKVSGKIYSRRGDNIAGISFAEITLIKPAHSQIDNLRRQFAVGLQNILPEPLASFGLGILIGQQNTLPEELTDSLRKVGLIHIVAVSGYNLTVIVYFSQRLLQKKSRFQALILSSLLVVIFLLITGFSPSIVRASVVSLISLVMWFYGRGVRPLMVLLLSAVVTAGWNPLYIWSSVGWYLSFSAFFGILVMAPLINKRFVPKKYQNSMLPQVFTETVSAQVCTLPILLFIFAGISVVSIPTNLLVVPLTPFVMLATLIAGLYGMIGPFLFGGIFVLPAKIMLSYIVEISRLLGATPFALINLNINAFQAGLMALLIIMLTIILAKKPGQKLTSNVLSNTV